MRAVYLFTLFGFIACARASVPGPEITEYFRASLSPTQGAPTVVSVLAQTSDGFLWLGSPAGLYRFDGVRFERIDSVGGTHLLGESIGAVEASKSGGLWIG
jgi:ligand-binding sensor domain-containing protein